MYYCVLYVGSNCQRSFVSVHNYAMRDVALMSMSINYRTCTERQVHHSNYSCYNTWIFFYFLSSFSESYSLFRYLIIIMNVINTLIIIPLLKAQEIK